MRLNSKKTSLIIILILFSFLAVNFCSAEFLKPETKAQIGNQAIGSAETGGYEISGDVLSLIQIVINAFLSLIGAIFLIYMLYAGYHWMTAQGEEEKVEKAKDTLKRAIIGAIILVGAYAISVFVISSLEGSLKNGGGQTPGVSEPVTTKT